MMICKGEMSRRRRKKIGVFLARRRRKKIENFAKNPDFFGSRFGPNHTQVPDPPLVFEPISSEGGGQVVGFVLIG